MTDPRETLKKIKEQADKARQARADYDAYRTEYLAPVLIEELKSKDDVPRLVGALQAVLDLHQPRTEHVITGDCSMEQCEHEEAKDCPKTPFEVCVRCYAIAVKGQAMTCCEDCRVGEVCARRGYCPCHDQREG